MISLVLDTSSPILSLHIVKDGEIIEHFYKEGKSQDLFKIIPKNGIHFDQMIVGLGPGSFTGLRAGITFAKTLCMVQAKPLSGVPSLEGFENPRQLPVYARSRKNELFEYIPALNRLSTIDESSIEKEFIGPVLLESSKITKKNIYEFLPHPLVMIGKANFKMPQEKIAPIYTRDSYAQKT